MSDFQDTLSPLQKCVIVVPVYLSKMSQTDRTSFDALCRVLGSSWPIAIATHSAVSLSEHQAIARRYGVSLRVELFDARFFAGLHGYNKLMLSPDFYRRFAESEYMLIYQLDVYVFRDELADWCNRGYDYIGGPLFALRHVRNTTKDAVVGNGGCSLRRISTMLRVLQGEGWHTLRWVFTYRIPRHPYVVLRRRFLYRTMLLAMGIGFRPLSDWITHFVAEDLFFSIALRGTPLELKVPPVSEAWQFAYNIAPQFWHEQNGRRLPFCCHAWPAQYQIFWHQYIPLVK